MTTADDLLTPHECHLGAPIRSLADAEAYRALGARAVYQRTSDDTSDREIAAWALDATVAHVADAATAEDRATHRCVGPRGVGRGLTPARGTQQPRTRERRGSGR